MLEGRKAISDRLGVKARRVPALVRAGAPIRVVHEGTGCRYLADSDALDAWVRGHSASLPVTSGN